MKTLSCLFVLEIFKLYGRNGIQYKRSEQNDAETAARGELVSQTLPGLQSNEMITLHMRSFITAEPAIRGLQDSR